VLIRVARSEAGVRHELEEFLAGMGLGLPIAVLLAGLGGFLLAGRALKPVGQMAARAETITAERLGERLPIENPDDELGRLGTVFNETLARLERSFETLRRFTADAAHELRTPLTALRSVGEVALRGGQANERSPEVLGSMLEEVDRLTRLVDTLLTLSRSDRGHVEIRAERLDLGRFARTVAEDLEVLADEKGQRIVLDEDTVYAQVDPRLLRQAVLNILDNAIRYSPEGMPIRVAVRRRAGTAVLEVTDQGPGIAPEHQERVFERFYRVDLARSRETGGAGLGLSIAQWAVQANGGTIELESQAGAGTCFRVCLPLAVPPVRCE
jgi:heavy metal sensor kinase